MSEVGEIGNLSVTCLERPRLRVRYTALQSSDSLVIHAELKGMKFQVSKPNVNEGTHLFVENGLDDNFSSKFCTQLRLIKMVRLG